MTSPADLADRNTPRPSIPASIALIRNPPLAESDFTERFLSRAEVLLITSTSCSFIYKKMEEGAFPRPVPLGGRRVAWLLSEVRQWMKERLQARDF
jgi:prophage regulatory protein